MKTLMYHLNVNIEIWNVETLFPPKNRLRHKPFLQKQKEKKVTKTKHENRQTQATVSIFNVSPRDSRIIA